MVMNTTTSWFEIKQVLCFNIDEVDTGNKEYLDK